MGFLCCICQEDLERRKCGQDEGGGADGRDKAQERPIVTTKCGHLYHSGCLSSWFQKQGAEVWTKKECPVCRMSLTVATDLIRIFPSSAEDGSPSVDDIKAHVSKLESYNQELSSRLEVQFIRGRDLEKKVTMMTKDLERLQKAYILERQKCSQFQSDAAKLKNENEELRNVVINLNLKTLGVNNGINLSSSTHNNVVGGGFQSQYGGKYTLSAQPGNTNLFGHGQSNSSNSTTTVGLPHSPTAEGGGTSGWPPNKSAPINIQEVRDSLASASINSNGSSYGGSHSHHSTSSGDFHAPSQVQNNSIMFPLMGGLKSSNGTSIFDSICGGNNKDMKTSFGGDDNSSSTGPDSDCSREETETGDSKHFLTSNNIFVHTSTSNMPLISSSSSSTSSTLLGDAPATNGYINNIGKKNNANTFSSLLAGGNLTVENNSSSLPSNSGINGKYVMITSGTHDVDQSPTEEMMDAILNSKPHTGNQDSDQFFLQRNKYGSSSNNDLKKPKGKTKWKAVEYEDNNNKKVYGKFYCENCTAKWGTARHVFNQAQTCMRCSEIVFPYAQTPVMTKEELAQEKMNRKRKP